MNSTIPCQKELTKYLDTGVDLNRNYDFKFGFDEEGSVNDPCDEIYRGQYAFSEPETRAIKDLVENNNIQAAMNFHSWGNLWITPFNYYKGDIKDVMKPHIYEFYERFFRGLENFGF